jgi:hypothetical protein
MIVNGTDLRTKYGLNVVWLSQTINPRTVNVYNNWLDGAIDPAKYKKTKYTEFEIYIEMLVKSESKEDCEKLMSSLMADFESGIVQLDDMEFLYKFDMAKEQRELNKRWLYHYELTLTGHAKLGKPVNESFTGTKYTTTIKGTAETPAVLSLTSDIALGSLTVEGLTEDIITISNVGRNTNILIDGESCVITENGEDIFDKVDLWSFPRASPGDITIKLGSTCSAKLSYYPRYI